jgi:hypothetical protein
MTADPTPIEALEQAGLLPEAVKEWLDRPLGPLCTEANKRDRTTTLAALNALATVALEQHEALKRLRCPACGHVGSLFVGSGSYLTCGIAECPNPDFAETVDLQTTALAAEKARAERAEAMLLQAFDEAGMPKPYGQAFKEWLADLARRTEPTP